MLGLKVDVDTLRGTRVGAPQLARMLSAAGAQATFLFSVGPDRTGRAIRRVLRRGFIHKVARTSVLEHYGLRTLLYGTLLPGPHIGRACASELRAIRADGFETGLHAYDHVEWQDFVAHRDAAWAALELRRGISAYVDVFGHAPKVHGAAGWQITAAGFEAEAMCDFDYCSDTRGAHPYLPVIPGATAVCAQLPTTLPTLDELIGVDGLTALTAVDRLLALTAEPPRHGHVFTLHAELEGMRLNAAFSRLLDGWRAQGYELVALREMFAALDIRTLPRHAVKMAPIEGRSGSLMRQGAAVAAPQVN
ncbi:MAG TPA: 4-deoxy-4-formamido-L-arabinose-phosphoundecaprenol deformylase [Burkholderiales bacterium]|nr:4-deoxy-4-formamido-L-arabinose-phosphoundecaprenol deformylase [Burkholderiales bacterium]